MGVVGIIGILDQEVWAVGVCLLVLGGMVVGEAEWEVGARCDLRLERVGRINGVYELMSMRMRI